MDERPSTSSDSRVSRPGSNEAGASVFTTSAEGRIPVVEREGSRLGYFVHGGQIIAAPRICVLVLDYEFLKDKKPRKNGNDKDVQNLRKTFQTNRRCMFREFKSKTRRELLEMISNENKLKGIFGIDVIPDVFIFILLSHGSTKGEIILDTHVDNTRDYEKILVTEIIDPLKDVFRNCLKIMFFGACRGSGDDVLHNAVSRQFASRAETRQEACHVSSIPKESNFVVVYSTVEGTTSNRHPNTGTWLVEKTCKVLNGLQQDESLVAVICKIQHEIHKASCSKNYERTEVAQTVEAVFTAHRNFMIKKSDCIIDSNVESADFVKEAFFNWTSDKGESIRDRQALIFCDEDTNSDDFQKLHEVLKTKLSFKTLCLPTENIFDCQLSAGMAEDGPGIYGCLFICIVTEKIEDNNGELHLMIKERMYTVGEIVETIVSTASRKWFGRPKIVFVIQKQPASTDHINIINRYAVKSTTNSGWFICVMPYEESLSHLVDLLSNPALNGFKVSFQELAAGLLKRPQIKKGGVIPKISSTLQYLLNFPNWPLEFVPPQLSVETIKKGEMTDGPRSLSLTELSSEFLRNFVKGKKRKQQLYVVSAQAGAGKSTILKELSSDFNKLVDSEIVATSLFDQYRFFEKYRQSKMKNLESFVENNYLRFSVKPQTLKSKTVTFMLDGFDELCPEFRDNVLDLMENIVKSQHLLWITTRPEEEAVILKELEKFEVLKISIQPLDIKRQREVAKLVSKRKRIKLSDAEIDAILSQYKKAGADDLLANPLHLSFLIEEKNRSETNLFEIYGNVIEKCLERGKLLPSPEHPTFKTELRKCSELLQDFAYQHLVTKSAGDEPKQFSEEEKKKISKSGIVTIPAGDMQRLRFEHQTFAEFLLAQKVVNDLKDDKVPPINIFEGRNNRKSVEFIDKFLYKNNSDGGKKIRSKLVSYLLDEKYNLQEILKEIIGGAHEQIFAMLKPRLTLRKEDQTARIKYVELSFETLEASCNVRSEKLGVKLMEMGALDALDDSDNKVELMKKIISGGCSKLFAKMTRLCPNILKQLGDVKPTLFAAENNSPVILKALLSTHGFSVKLENSSKETALHKASEKGHIVCIKELIKQGAEVNAASIKGKTALHLAARNGYAGVVKFLLTNNAKPELEDSNGCNSLHLAVLSKEYDVFRAFSLKSVEFFDKELKRCAKEFLELVAKGETRSYDMCSTIIESSESQEIYALGKYTLDLILPKGKKKTDNDIEFASDVILGTKKFMKSSNSDGWTVLHSAVAEGKNNQVKACLLQKEGARKIELKTENEKLTPLLLAAKFSGVRMLNFLLKKGASVKAVDSKKNTCLHHACFRGDSKIIKWLLLHIDERNKRIVNAKNVEGKTALHIVAEKCTDLSVLEAFANKKPRWSAKDERKKTAFHHALKHNTLEVIKYLQNKLPNSVRNAISAKVILKLSSKNPNENVREEFKKRKNGFGKFAAPQKKRSE